MSDSTTESERPEIIHTPDGPDDNQVVIDDTKKYIRYDIHKKKLAEVSGANEPGEGKASEVRVNARVSGSSDVLALLESYDPSYKELGKIKNWVERQYEKSHERSMEPVRYQNSEMNKYKPSKDFIEAFNDLAGGYSHSFRYEQEKGKLFFSALTDNCGIIQLYADTTDEMEEKFIKKVKECL